MCRIAIELGFSLFRLLADSGSSIDSETQCCEQYPTKK